MSTIIVCGLLIVIIAFIITNLLKNRKQKDCSCGCGNCKGCH